MILNLVLFCLIVLTKVWGAQRASELTDILLKLLITCVLHVFVILLIVVLIWIKF